MQPSAMCTGEKDLTIRKSNRIPIFKIQRDVMKPIIDKEVSTGPSNTEEENNSIKREGRSLRQSRKITKDKEGHISRGQRSCWDQTEDERVLELFQEHGPKWSKLARLLGNRKSKQVRDRYMNVLRPGINLSPWTDEEDELFIELLGTLGKKWCQIAENMPGRTENQAKNRFYWHMNKHNVPSSKKAALSQTCQRPKNSSIFPTLDPDNSEKDQNQISFNEFSEGISFFESPSSVDECFLEKSIHQIDSFVNMTHEERILNKINNLVNFGLSEGSHGTDLTDFFRFEQNYL